MTEIDADDSREVTWVQWSIGVASLLDSR